jgi:hypothetical protein
MLGSTEPFLQHCQLPDMMPNQHLCALINKLNEDVGQASTVPKGKHILRLLHNHISNLLAPPPTTEVQRVSENTLREAREAEKRVIDDSPIITIPRIMDAPGIIEARNPTAKQNLKATPCMH